MKPNEPSRTALIPARQRAAHQVLDHGSILYDPFAMKILREDEKDVLQFANEHPLASIGRLFTTARSRIAEDALSRAVERGVRQIVILGAGLDTFALRNPHGALEVRIYEVDYPRRRHGNAGAWPKLKSHFRHRLFSCQSISSATIWERRLSPQAFKRTRPRFSLGSGVCHI
jgi:methyltransferase (TIGR00027 family)